LVRSLPLGGHALTLAVLGNAEDLPDRRRLVLRRRAETEVIEDPPDRELIDGPDRSALEAEDLARPGPLLHHEDGVAGAGLDRVHAEVVGSVEPVRVFGLGVGVEVLGSRNDHLTCGLRWRHSLQAFRNRS